MILKRGFSVMRSSVVTLIQNPGILYPYAIVGILQLFILEILFFMPRYPLIQIFGPMILALKKSPFFLHYPFNFEVVNSWFQSMQVPFYVFVQILFVAKAVLIVQKTEQRQAVESMPKVAFGKYVNLVVGAAIIIGLMYAFNYGYSFLIRRAVQIRSTSGLYFLIKQAVILGGPYINLMVSAFITACFAYVIPLIAIEGDNVFKAVFRNFKLLKGDFFILLTFLTVAALCFVPFLLVKTNEIAIRSMMTPEGWQMITILGAGLILLIDALQYTGITIVYLKKDRS